MNRGKHVVAVDDAGADTDRDEILLTEEATETALPAASGDADRFDWAGQQEPSPPARRPVAPFVAGLAIAAWTGLFVWSKFAVLSGPPTFDQGVTWFGTWSGPVLLVGVIWLLVMRSSRREATRFNDAARLLRLESDLLSTRLASVNNELSLARDFIAAQGRDLESLGRLAAERLTENAQTLQSLIQSNGEQVEAIGTVSATALDNMEKLRGQLPVIANAARDVTNNIGNAGRTAHSQIQEMIAGFKRINEFGQASERQIGVLRDLASETMAGLLEQSARLEEITARRFDEVVEKTQAIRQGMDEDTARSVEAFGARVTALAERSAELAARLGETEEQAIAALAERLSRLDEDIAARRESQLVQLREMEGLGDALSGRMDAAEERFGAINALAGSAEARLGESLAGLEARLAASRDLLEATDREIGNLTDSGVRLLEIIQAGSQHSREKLPEALSEAEQRLASVETRIQSMRTLAEEAVTLGGQLNEAIEQTQSGLAGASVELEALNGRIEGQARLQADALASIRDTLSGIANESEALAGRLESQLADAVARIASERGEALAGQIEQAAQRASEASRESAIQLRDQLAKVDELAGNLERRVARARERAEERVENDFARRVALINEALNSHAIDISRALDSDVSDVSWAAYLKGDRGIFTRRAVSLLQAGEGKAVMQVYENDPDFQGHVNRYIHDFEAMLRQILSTRDGEALGVTLLSSDMGKLYVALAQAIERLRR